MYYAFDAEVFSHDWLFVFKNLVTGEYTRIHNNNYQLKQFVTEEKVFFGFNAKRYDQFIMRAILAGADNSRVKEMNDYLIAGNFGWDHWYLKEHPIYLNVVDLMDDMQLGLSLKAIEGHLGLAIHESAVSFDIDRRLNKDELEEAFQYCQYDVDMVEELIKLRKDYLKAKLSIGRMVGIQDVKALSMTNAKLTAAFLGAKQVPRYDERQYTYPENLNLNLIPRDVKAFYDQMKDESISSEDLFNRKIDVELAPGVVATYGFGGIHQAIPNYQEVAEGNRIIRNYDVASLYPSLMVLYGYTSRNIPDSKRFERVYYDRLKAKREGNKIIADSYKLVLNTTYGAMLNQYNDLYDPLMGRSVCISGQLFITQLVMSYLKALRTVKIIQTNTDGVMVSLDISELPELQRVNAQWEEQTGFTLEEDQILRVVQKDVNNYLIESLDGKIKTKGGYLTYGISKAGAFNINNNTVIVAKALIAYFTKGVPVEETIESCQNILDFQFIAKAGSKYSEAYHLIDGNKIPVQRVNRVYAVKDKRFGTLYKVHAATGRAAKIEGLPEHCITDNSNELDITIVDRDFYVEMAKKRINDFLGKPEPTDEEWVRLSDLAKLRGVGPTLMARIREGCELKRGGSWIGETNATAKTV